MRAQSEAVESAFPSLIAPNGARLASIGSAGVADQSARDAMLSNPAGLARMAAREVSLDFAQDGVGSRYIVSAAVPVRIVGTFGAAVYVFNEGQFENKDSIGTTTGQTIVRDVAYTASYATRFGRHFLVGLNYKYLQKRYDCSGGCDDPTLTSTRPSTTAIDAGLQVDSITRYPIAIGLAIRNAGLPFQYKDNDQRDPLPTQAALGISVGVLGLERYVPNSSLRLFGEVTKGIGATPTVPSTYHVGSELTYQRSLALRVGYAKRYEGDGYSGPTLGIGFTRKRFTLDVARQLGASGLLADQPPTYVGLHYAF